MVVVDRSKGSMDPTPSAHAERAFVRGSLLRLNRLEFVFDQLTDAGGLGSEVSEAAKSLRPRWIA
jgi:hypothetical protein